MAGTCSHCGQKVENTCLWCGEPAIASCDAWIGGETVIANGLKLFSLRGDQFLCDAPMCNEHRNAFGFVCGSEPGSLDHCPVHASQRVTHDIATAATSKAEADAARRAVWA